MTKNMMITMAIDAISKVKPSYDEAHLNEKNRQEYEKWMEVIRWLKTLRDQENEMIKDPDEEYEPDNGPIYSNGETTVLYDVDGEQHVECGGE